MYLFQRLCRHFLLPGGLLLMLLFVGCAADDKDSSSGVNGPIKLVGSPAALTDTAARVLGFEDASADWSNISSVNDIHTQGTVSAQVNLTGWMQMTSIPLSDIVPSGTVLGTSAAIDVRLPEAAGWGEIRLIVDIPSQGIWWRDLGGVQLSSLTAGTFSEAAFVIPSDVATALSGSYSDLRFILVLNGPAMTEPMLLDNLRFAGTSGNDTDTGEAMSFLFELPVGVTLENAVITASSSLRLAPGVHIANSAAHVVNMGSGLTEVNADDEIDGNLIVGGDLFLGERAAVHGVVQAGGNITEQNSVVVDGGSVSDTPVVTGATYGWNVDWPASDTVIEVNFGDEMDLAPGAYAGVTLQSGGELTIHAGTYFVNDFVAHSGSQIHVIGDGAAVILYVKDSLTSRAQLQHSTSSADFFVGYTGMGVAELDGPFAGTVVAPNATIRLAPLNGGSHEGSFFAERIEVEANTPVNRVTFDHWNEVLPDPETELPVIPPDTLPMPPREVGCYLGSPDGWMPVPCAEDAQDGDRYPELDQWAIMSQPVDATDTDSYIPLQYAQLETTLVTFGGVTDVYSTDTDTIYSPDEFSVQLNTNKFFAKEDSVYADAGDVGVVQFAIQEFGSGANVCIWQINRTRACGVPIDVPCPENQDWSQYHTYCFKTGPLSTRIGTRSTGLQQYDYASIGVSTYNDGNGDPVIGMVTRMTWVDRNGSWKDTLEDVDTDDYQNFNASNDLFAIVQYDYMQLNTGMRDISGDFFGLGNRSEAQFSNSSVLTRLLAGSCVNTVGPDPEIPWPGVCPNQDAPLLDSTAIGTQLITAETCNLTLVRGPSPLVSSTEDLVYTQYLSSTSGICDTNSNRIYVKDVPTDVGVLPSNYAGEPFWESPDIFVVPTGTPVDVNAIASEALLAPGQTYDFYVRVHNDFGCNPVHHAMASIYLADPSALSATWSAVTNGYESGAATDDVVVNPGESALVGPITWTAPNDAAVNGHKCVLASIKSDTQGAPTNTYDAPGSYQVAQRNVQFSDCAYPITNATTQDGNIRVTLTVEGGTPSLSAGNDIEMRFDDPSAVFYNVWTTGQGEEYSVSHAAGVTTVRLGKHFVDLDPVPFNNGTSINAIGSMVLQQGTPTTLLRMQVELIDSNNQTVILTNGSSCSAYGPIIIPIT